MLPDEITGGIIMNSRTRAFFILIFLIFILTALSISAADKEFPIISPPDRSEGEGPFKNLILYGPLVIDGTAALPYGPAQITIKNNRITEIKSVGVPGMEIKDPPTAQEGEKILDLRGMYVLPGLINMHCHIGSTKGIPAEYVYKLLLSHGVTTIREVGTRNGLDWLIGQKKKSHNSQITAPRIFAYHVVWSDSPEDARQQVNINFKEGADGVKIFGQSPSVYKAILDEAKKKGLRIACHLSQNEVGRTNILQLARMGLTSMEHWYGLPESFLAESTIQNWPLDAVYNNEQDRFGNAGTLWSQAAAPYTPKWNKVMDELIALDFTLVPTLTIYEANRDLMRARRAEWHETYTLPVLWRFYEPSRTSHGAYWYDWTTEQEVAWKNNYKLWMTFLNEYKNRGGRVATGADSGFIYKLWGFDYIRELELLREAGFHPLEVIRAATLRGAEALGQEKEIGTVEIGKLADLLVVGENPLANLKVLYGTGAIKLNKDNKAIRVGGVKYTIKDGIVYDAKQLLKDVKDMVEKAKLKEKFKLTQPGLNIE